MSATNRKVLSNDEIATALADLPGWSVADRKLHREYKFADFSSAIGFMMAAAVVIEKLDHHPEWFNVYSTVKVDYWTHSSGGITPMDVKLAGILEAIARKLL